MALAVSFEFDDYPSGYSNWFDVLYNFKSNFYEVAILGNEAVEKSNLINLKYLPNKLIVGSNKKNDLPLLEAVYMPIAVNPDKYLKKFAKNKKIC